MSLKKRSAISTNMVFLSLVTVDEKKNKINPYFRISRVQEGKIVQTDETCEVLTGDLYKINFKEKVFRNKTTPTVDLIFKDSDGSDEMYCWNVTYRNSVRSLFNALASLENFNKLEISVYNNKKGYEAISLRQDGERVDWKYELSELPAVQHFVVNKQEVSDFSEIDDFFAAELKEIQKFLADTYGYEVSESKTVNMDKGEEGSGEESDSEEQKAPVEEKKETRRAVRTLRPVTPRAAKPVNNPKPADAASASDTQADLNEDIPF